MLDYSKTVLQGVTIFSITTKGIFRAIFNAATMLTILFSTIILFNVLDYISLRAIHFFYFADYKFIVIKDLSHEAFRTMFFLQETIITNEDNTTISLYEYIANLHKDLDVYYLVQTLRNATIISFISAFVISAFTTILVSIKYFEKKGLEIQEEKFIRGAKLTTVKEYNRLILEEAKKEVSWRNYFKNGFVNTIKDAFKNVFKIKKGA